MSVLARRGRDEQFARERELVAMRDAVVRATTAAVPAAGSSATLEAVDEALAQLVAADAHLADPVQVKAMWVKYARCRLLDEHGSADAKRRDATSVDEHTQALAVSDPGDPDEVLEDDRQSWRVREILSVLHGEQRKWAEAWYREVLSALPAGAQPRGLPDALGWTTAKTEKTSQRARRTMGAFVTRRQNGEICVEQRALLDGFVAASSGELSDLLEHDRFEAIVFHVAGCDDCFATWHSRRRTLSRPLAMVMLPVDAIATAAYAFAAKVAAITTSAVTSVLGRLGIGGAAAAGGSAATIGGKTAAVCVGVVCAATAGGELAGVVPPLLPDPAPQTRERDEPRARAQGPAEPKPVVREPAAAAVTPPPPPPPPPATAPPTSPPPPAVSPPPPPVAVMPGDLPLEPTSASSPTSATATSSAGRPTQPLPPPPPPPAAPSGGFSCVPGDLGC
jgi:hypothetical protein